MGARLLGDLLVDLDDVLVAQLLTQTAFHGTELAGSTPYHSMSKLLE